MTTIDHNSPNWLESILRDPGATIDDPEAVLSSTELTGEEKLRVLRGAQAAFDDAFQATQETRG